MIQCKDHEHRYFKPCLYKEYLSFPSLLLNPERMSSGVMALQLLQLSRAIRAIIRNICDTVCRYFNSGHCIFRPYDGFSEVTDESRSSRLRFCGGSKIEKEADSWMLVSFIAV